MKYVFTKGIEAPYGAMFDNIDGVGPNLIVESERYDVSGYNNSRKLARLSDGTLYFVYQKQLAGNYQIYIKKSIDGGVTWTNETRISTYPGMENHSPTRQCIAVDSNDCLHVIFEGLATGYITGPQVWYTKYDGSWSTPLRISTLAGMYGKAQWETAIAVDSSDCVHVVWIGQSFVGYPNYFQVWYAKYDGSWSSPVRISTYTGMDVDTQRGASIAIDSKDHIHVVWDGKAYGFATDQNTQIWHTVYDGSWHTPVRISNAAGMEDYKECYPSIAVGLDDYLHVVWTGRSVAHPTNYQIWYAKYDTEWRTPVRISTYAGMENCFQFFPSIAVDSSGYVHVLWHGMATGYTDQNKIWHAKYTDSWAVLVCLQPTGRNTYPSLRWSRWPLEAPPVTPISPFWRAVLILGPLAVGAIAITKTDSKVI